MIHVTGKHLLANAKKRSRPKQEHEIYRASEEPSKKPASYRYRRLQNPFRPGFEQTTKRLASVCSDPPAKGGERKKNPDNHVMQKGVNQKKKRGNRQKEKKTSILFPLRFMPFVYHGCREVEEFRERRLVISLSVLTRHTKGRRR